MKLYEYKNSIIKILEDQLSFLKSQYNVSKIGLFGSFARDEQKETSDIDLLVEFSQAISFFALFKLEDYLSDLLRLKVEIVTPNALKEFIAPNIIRDVIYVE